MADDQETMSDDAIGFDPSDGGRLDKLLDPEVNVSASKRSSHRRGEDERPSSRTEEATSMRLHKMEPSDHDESFEGALSCPSSNALDKFQFIDH